MIGRRVYHLDTYRMTPGDYGIIDTGDWYAYCPWPPEARLVANLSGHTVTVHEDDTITVSPSIACGDGAGGHRFHGFLERGIWRNA